MTKWPVSDPQALAELLELHVSARPTVLDCTVVQNGSAARSDPKHNNKWHVRNQWAFWLVLRNGPACHGPGRRLKHELTCQVCGTTFFARRSDAKTHDGTCRATLYRQQHSATAVPQP